MDNQNEENKKELEDKKVIDNFIATKNEESALKKQWKEEIANNVALQNYLQQFRKDNIEPFIEHYVYEKYQINKYGAMYKDIADKNQDKWIDYAHDGLNAILQKKLFDLQCQWRAEQIELEGVVIAFDFEVWGNNIYECPFLEPINTYDLKLYNDYLMSNNTELDYISNYEWQNYDDIKEAYTADEDEYDVMPDWYEFHNNRTGNSSLLLLPDVRGQKEDFYIALHHQKHRVENPVEESEEQIINNNKPFLFSHDKEIFKYIMNTFEDREMQKKYKYYTEGALYEDDEKSGMSELFNQILDVREPIPIDSNYNMLDAIKKAYNNYQLRKIAEHLPIAYDQYLLNKQMGFSSDVDNTIMKSIRKAYYHNIIDGRLINGEEPNLDF